MALLDEETKNLAKVGMFSPIDMVFMAAFMATFFAVSCEVTFPEHVNPYTVTVTLLIGALITQAWLVLLIFRCINFTVRTQAKVEVITEEAARRAANLMQTAQQAAAAESKAAAK